MVTWMVIQPAEQDEHSHQQLRSAHMNVVRLYPTTMPPASIMLRQSVRCQLAISSSGSRPAIWTSGCMSPSSSVPVHTSTAAVAASECLYCTSGLRPSGFKELPPNVQQLSAQLVLPPMTLNFSGGIAFPCTPFVWPLRPQDACGGLAAKGMPALI